MAEHTPGPWRVGNGHWVVADTPVPEVNGSDAVEFYGGHLICESVNEDNARLIAAAPDLLAACELALEWTTAFPLGIASTREDETAAQNVRNAARAAIAKAKGGER